MEWWHFSHCDTESLLCLLQKYDIEKLTSYVVPIFPSLVLKKYIIVSVNLIFGVLILELYQHCAILFSWNIRETKGAIKNGQSRETGNNGYTRQNKKTNKTKHNTIYVGHHSTQDTSYTLCHMLTCLISIVNLISPGIFHFVHVQHSKWPLLYDIIRFF
jgi:hypothetical protein